MGKSSDTEVSRWLCSGYRKAERTKTELESLSCQWSRLQEPVWGNLAKDSSCPTFREDT